MLFFPNKSIGRQDEATSELGERCPVARERTGYEPDVQVSQGIF